VSICESDIEAEAQRLCDAARAFRESATPEEAAAVERVRVAMGSTPHFGGGWLCIARMMLAEVAAARAEGVAAGLRMAAGIAGNRANTYVLVGEEGPLGRALRNAVEAVETACEAAAKDAEP
jgi:hypothetical protein